MRVTIDTAEEIIRKYVVPAPISVTVAPRVTEDVFDLYLTASCYSKRELANELEITQASPEQLTNLILARAREALLALSEQLVEMAALAEKAP